jgi:hypothetical protein
MAIDGDSALENIAALIQSGLAKGEKVAKGVLGPAYEPVRGLAQVLTPDVPAMYETVKQFAEQGSPSALTAVVMAGALESPVGKAIKPVSKNIEKIFPVKMDSIGGTEASIDTYSGITIPMTKNKFFDNVEKLDNPRKDSINFLAEQMKKGKEIGRPFITLQWTGKTFKPLKESHEGRHRMLAAEKTFGKDVVVPVNVRLRTKSGSTLPIDELIGRTRFYKVKGPEEAALMKDDLKKVLETSDPVDDVLESNAARNAWAGHDTSITKQKGGSIVERNPYNYTPRMI